MSFLKKLLIEEGILKRRMDGTYQLLKRNVTTKDDLQWESRQLQNGILKTVDQQERLLERVKSLETFLKVEYAEAKVIDKHHRKIVTKKEE